VFTTDERVDQFITGDALSRLQASHLTSANYIDPLSLSRMTFDGFGGSEARVVIHYLPGSPMVILARNRGSRPVILVRTPQFYKGSK